MTHYDRLKQKRLGDILVDEELATEQSVIAALQQQQETGRLLSDILLEQREVSDWDLARVIVEQYQAPFIDLRNYTLHKDLIEKFPRELLNDAAVIPLDKFGNQICFACQEIPSEEIAAKLKEQASSGIYVFIASAVDIRQALQRFAPIAKPVAAGVSAGAASPEVPALPLDALEGDQGWKSIFDDADATVLSELTEPDDDVENDE